MNNLSSNDVKKLFNKSFAAGISIYFLSISLITHSFHWNNHYLLLNSNFKCMQLKQHKLNGNKRGTKRGLSTKCEIVKEVFVSKRAVLLSEHAAKNKQQNPPKTSIRVLSVTCWNTQCHEFKSSFFSFKTRFERCWEWGGKPHTGCSRVWL